MSNTRTHEPPGALPAFSEEIPKCIHDWKLFFAVDLGMTRDEISHCPRCGTSKHEVKCDGSLCHGYPRYMILAKSAAPPSPDGENP